MSDVVKIPVQLGVEGIKYLANKVREQKRSIEDAQQQAEGLDDNLRFLINYVKTSGNNPQSDDLLTADLLREVCNRIYLTEDVIDSFKADTDSNWIIPNQKKVAIAELLKSVVEKVADTRKKVDQHIKTSADAAQAQTLVKYEGAPEKQKYASIFEKEEERLREMLTREAEEPEVIFITGAHGIGKTTLAAKMYHDSDMKEKKQFSKQIWVEPSDPTPRNILLAVLSCLNETVEAQSTNSQLSVQVKRCLKEHKFLIVLDSVAEMKPRDWKNLKSALQEGNDKRSKILVISNNDSFALASTPYDSQIKLDKLNGNDSWKLLQFLVFGEAECPAALVDDGLKILGNCDDLPKAIELAAEALKSNDSPGRQMSERQKTWQDVSLRMVEYLNDRTTPKSYHKLPYHLKMCFLYLGIFGDNSKFSTSKVIHMWIGEGFVHASYNLTSEETAQGYLKDLIARNLVRVEETAPDGSPKTCSLNALLFEFCRRESGNDKENFLQGFRKDRDGNFNPSVNEAANKNRRVFVHSHVNEFIPKLVSSEHHSFQISLRSFVSHSKEPAITLHASDLSKIRAAFKLLRVLDARPIEVNKIHSDLCQLVHLRFVTLTLNGGVLPEAISKLREVRTLIVHTKSRTLEVKADILKMDQLRHFKTDASATLPRKTKATDKDKRLQTLCGVSPVNCTQDFFNRTPEMKKLGICGQLALLVDANKAGVLSKLDSIEKLKLVNYVANPKSQGRLSHQILDSSRLPKNLWSLTLSATRLEWSHISVLGSVPKLKELKLKDDAFVGDQWDVHNEGFPLLQVLHIENIHFKQWKSSAIRHFPKITHLSLSNCNQLREIPIDLADISDFVKLHLSKGCHPSASECARTIRDIKLEKKKVNKSLAFELTR